MIKPSLAAVLLAASVLTPPAVRAQEPARPTMQVRISTADPAAAAALRRLPTLDILQQRPGWIDALIVPANLATLRAAGLDPVVVHPDIEAFFASRLHPVQAAAGGSSVPTGSMGGFLTWAEILALLDQWRATYPNLITQRTSIGKTLEGREQWIVKVSANADTDEDEPEIYIESLIHAREPGGMMSVMRCLEYLLQGYGTDPVATDLLDNREIWYLPVMNVDGYEYNRQIQPGGGGSWRKNRRPNGSSIGVDLNRNFGYQWGYDNSGSSSSPSSSTYRGTAPFSEPAAANVRDFILSRRDHGMTTAWDVHSYSGLCMFPWGYANLNTPQHAQYTEMTADMVRENRYAAGIVNTTLYPINGGAVDWFHGSAGLWGWLPELGASFWPATSRIRPLTEENLHMLLTAIEYAGPYLIDQGVTVTEVGNGDGVFDPGEKIEVRCAVRNRGVLPATATRFELSSATPFAQVEVGSAALGDVASFTDADNNSAPLRAAIGSFTAPGTRLQLTVHYRFAGHDLTVPLDVFVGAPRVVVSDACESSGWQLGADGDTAVRGRWAWGDPYQTTAASGNGYVVQTGDDHTPSGTHCYVTGNQNTANGTADDVDGGFTTLTTPSYDLSTTREPYVEFWRWFMDHGSMPNNDTLVVSVSDNGGASWTPVDVVSHSQQSWQRHCFRLRDYVEPTAQVRLRFVAGDDPDDSDCEAAIDDLTITDYDDGVRIALRGPARIGRTTTVDLTAPRSAGLPYAAAVAFGSRPGIRLPSGRLLPLNADPLLMAYPSLGSLFQNFTGTLDGAGNGTAQIALPALAGLVGVRFFAAFVTLDSAAPETVRDISAAVAVDIAP